MTLQRGGKAEESEHHTFGRKRRWTCLLYKITLRQCLHYPGEGSRAVLHLSNKQTEKDRVLVKKLRSPLKHRFINYIDRLTAWHILKVDLHSKGSYSDREIDGWALVCAEQANTTAAAKIRQDP